MEMSNTIMANERITPRKIDKLGDNEVYVFGSNLGGQHVEGYAAMAFSRFGARMGQAEGLQGKSYAICVHGPGILEKKRSIIRFLRYALMHPENRFIVTDLGCIGNKSLLREVAPMFYDVKYVNIYGNVTLPVEFWNIINRMSGSDDICQKRSGLFRAVKNFFSRLFRRK